MYTTDTSIVQAIELSSLFLSSVVSFTRTYSKVIIFLSPIDSLERGLGLSFHLVESSELLEEVRVVEGTTQHAEAIALICLQNLEDRRASVLFSLKTQRNSPSRYRPYISRTQHRRQAACGTAPGTREADEVRDREHHCALHRVLSLRWQAAAGRVGLRKKGSQQRQRHWYTVALR